MSIARPLTTVAALVPLVMPKCPLCAMALFAALGIEARAIAPVTIALIALPVVAAVLRHSSIAIPLIACVGAVAAIGGRFVGDEPLLFHAGVLAVVGASVVNTVLIRRRCRKCVLTS